MQQIEIELESRKDTGSTANRRLRNSGKIPAVVYSHGQPASTVSVIAKDFLKIGRVARSSQIFTIKSTDAKFNGKPAVVKEVQRSYLSSESIFHVDFQLIRDDEELTVLVPVKVSGEAPGVKIDGGILTVVCHELAIRCLPKFIPSEVEADVTQLRLGNSIHALELKLPEGVRLGGNPGETIVSVVAVRTAVEEEVAAATPAEGAAAAPGAATAAGATAAAPGAAAAEEGDKAEKPAAKKEAKK